DRFEQLFANTDIGRNPTPARNSHLVMRFDFSKVPVSDTISGLRQRFDDECLNSFESFLGAYSKLLPDFQRPATGDAAAQLSRILEAVRRSGAPPVHIIIDEYDNFTNQLLTTHKDNLYKEVTTGDSFLRTFFKVIKSGIGEGAVARVFITGVLPITIDDLTSGFNIAQIITLEEHTLEMMGFTQAEVDAYVGAIFAERGWPDDLQRRVLEDLRAHYNGYRLLPDARETLYNSTICNFYLNKLVIGNGKVPREMIDDNLRVDVNWLRRLTGGTEPARELVEQLMFDGALPVDMDMLSSKFSMSRFFQREFFPLSLYYLGMVTFRDRFSLGFPNLSVKKIFTEYFNELEHISVSEGYTDMFRRFLADSDWAALFAGYWERYVGQIPAQAFDKANENFFRTTFYELCTRYISPEFHFAIEVNMHSGRSDWQAVGRKGSAFEGKACVIEFKHFTRKEGERRGILSLDAPQPEDIEQVDRYAEDLQRAHPELTIVRHVAYTVAGAGGRLLSTVV
ncbi:MAG: AAA family ATPase, partial [Lentisphaerae bacterium]|nr:AAA family ATPase [Lentisphaerota bacterium]